MNQKKRALQEITTQERTSVIIKVLAGLLTVSEAAKKLGISRKTYYELEPKALAGMMKAIDPRKAGRPKKTIDAEQKRMKKEIKTLKQQATLNQMKLRVRDLFKGLNVPGSKPITLKKTGS